MFRNLSASEAANYPPLLHAMWHEAQGNWDAAHSIAQDIETPDASWVHAYLHRREGDAWNAEYWYRRANRPVFKQSMEQEWTALVEHLLAKCPTAG